MSTDESDRYTHCYGHTLGHHAQFAKSPMAEQLAHITEVHGLNSVTAQRVSETVRRGHHFADHKYGISDTFGIPEDRIGYTDARGFFDRKDGYNLNDKVAAPSLTCPQCGRSYVETCANCANLGASAMRELAECRRYIVSDIPAGADATNDYWRARVAKLEAEQR